MKNEKNSLSWEEEISQSFSPGEERLLLRTTLAIVETCTRFKAQGRTELPCHVVYDSPDKFDFRSLFDKYSLDSPWSLWSPCDLISGKLYYNGWASYFRHRAAYYRALILSQFIWNRHYSEYNGYLPFKFVANNIEAISNYAYKCADECGVYSDFLRSRRATKMMDRILHDSGIQGSIKEKLWW